ncbi:hypothetical protein Patl1_29308 [Pistacia atlantica]|uniref:Uncharacterized protein n=1 Tax=Pistacia atlantica TaxID=434234 RepID=A0ACC1BFD8_9ROSI|nr:hypothetical protein Patl1_29308 [Pistacia atlantica]
MLMLLYTGCLLRL